jgi:hypothetical protein
MVERSIEHRSQVVVIVHQQQPFGAHRHSFPPPPEHWLRKG